MQKIFFLVMTSFALLYLSSCSKGNGTNGGDPGGNPGGGNTGPLFTAVRSVMQTHCAVASCHATPNPQNGINLGDNATIVAQRLRIKVRAVDEAGTPNQMPQPPRAPLSSVDQKKITDWIGAGGRMSD